MSDNKDTNIKPASDAKAPDTKKAQVKNNDKNNLDSKYPTKRGFVGYFAFYAFSLFSEIVVNMKCIGRENFPTEAPYVVASNHQSYPDGLWIAHYFPKGHFKKMCCLAASDLETSHGWLGRLIMKVGRGIAVDRYGNPVRGLIKAKKEVDKGDICLVFPEGTRSVDGQIGEMKDGASYLAIKANVPLVPIFISGAYQVWPRSSRFMKPFKGFLRRKKMRIFVGEPMYGKDFDNDPRKMTAAFDAWIRDMHAKYYDPENAPR